MTISYFFFCALMGLGIGVDVALATIARTSAMRDERAATIWTASVTVTHILFPMIGYYGFLGLIRAFPAFRIILGALAFVFVVYFLVVAVRGWTDETTKAVDSRVGFAAVLAVSLDALWSGPAKSAQAIYWTQIEVLFSFVLAGAVVTVMAIGSRWVGKRVHESISQGATRTVANRTVVAQLVEFTVIGYFGMLALFRYVFDITLLTPPLVLSALATLVISLFFWRRMLTVAEIRSARL